MNREIDCIDFIYKYHISDFVLYITKILWKKEKLLSFDSMALIGHENEHKQR